MASDKSLQTLSPFFLEMNPNVSWSPSFPSPDPLFSFTEVQCDGPQLDAVKMAQFFKTKMCPWYPEGRCRMGTRCNWAHSPAELRPSVDLTNTKLCESLFKRGRCDNPFCRFAHSRDKLRATTDVYKTSMCIFWERGGCAAGENCRYAHGKQDLRPKSLDEPSVTSPSDLIPHAEDVLIHHYLRKFSEFLSSQSPSLAQHSLQMAQQEFPFLRKNLNSPDLQIQDSLSCPPLAFGFPNGCDTPPVHLLSEPCSSLPSMNQKGRMLPKRIPQPLPQASSLIDLESAFKNTQMFLSLLEEDKSG